MQYVTIKQEQKEGREYFLVNAIPLKNVKNSVVQRIPHPLGSDVLEYETLEDAKAAITRAGFSYILPNGEKGCSKPVKQNIVQNTSGYEQIVLDTIKSKVNSSHSTVSAAALLALGEFSNEEVFDILFSKLGEENDQVRKNAIASICRYAPILQDRVINSLKSSNWVERNSALGCIAGMVTLGNCDIEKFIMPLTEACEDSNVIVQTSAITTLTQVYQAYQKIGRKY